MISKAPNEEERKKLQKIVKFNNQRPIYLLCLSSLSLNIIFVLKHYPILGTVLSVLIFAGMIYLLLTFAILIKCPRCSSWGTPVTGGNCSKCGLHLDTSCDEEKTGN